MIYGSLEYHFDASEGSVHLRNLKIGGRKRRIGRNGALGERTPLGTAIDVEQVRRARPDGQISDPRRLRAITADAGNADRLDAIAAIVVLSAQAAVEKKHHGERLTGQIGVRRPEHSRRVRARGHGAFDDNVHVLGVDAAGSTEKQKSVAWVFATA